MTSTSPVMAYRPDIDGLRAVAVLAVVIYHAFPTLLPGGFVGVDIFFVISGYLIGGIIMRDLAQGSFTFRNFYTRRVRRIFPALAVVLGGLLLIGWFVLLPGEYAAVGKHVFGGASFVANLLLWQEAGYFDVAAKGKPLLHLWSLGIEEQFYIVFPLLLWFCAKKRWSMLGAITVLGVLSLADNLWLFTRDRTADFYSPLTRFWELLAGAALAAAMRRPDAQAVYRRLDAWCARLLHPLRAPQVASAHDGRSLSLLLAVTGSVLLVLALLLARGDEPWPGWLAMFPVLGSVCLIAAGALNPLSHYVLANRFSVFIGRISYPLYLCHWPLLACAWLIHGSLGPHTWGLRLQLVLLAFVLATLIYFFVEKPVRFGPRFRGGKLVLLLCAMSALACGGLYAYMREGFPQRQGVAHLSAQLAQFHLDPCTDAAGLRYAGIAPGTLEYCRYTDVGASRTVAVVGDSHAHFAYPGLARLGQKLGFNTVLLGRFIPGGEAYHPERLLPQEKAIFAILREKRDIAQVFLCTRGVVYMTGEQNYSANLTPEDIEEDRRRALGRERFARGLQDAVDYLASLGKHVYVVGENPELPDDPRGYVSRPLRPVKVNAVFPTVRKADVVARQREYLEVLGSLRGAEVVDVLPAFCPVDTCPTHTPEGLSMYFDDDHISPLVGSDFQAERILRPYLERSPGKAGEQP